MLSNQEEEVERRETLENDRKVREAEHQRLLREGTTFHQHAQSHANDEAGGRFAAVNAATVVGAQPLPVYPAASSAHQTELPPEPSLGYSVGQLDPLESPSFAQGQLPDSAPAAAASVQAPLLPDVAQRDAESGPCSDGERDG